MSYSLNKFSTCISLRVLISLFALFSLLSFPKSISAQIIVPEGWILAPSNNRFVYRIEGLPAREGEDLQRRLMLGDLERFQRTGDLNVQVVYSSAVAHSISPVVDVFPGASVSALKGTDFSVWKNIVVFSVRLPKEDGSFVDQVFFKNINPNLFPSSSVYSDGIARLLGSSDTLVGIEFLLDESTREYSARLKYRSFVGGEFVRLVDKRGFVPDATNALDDEIERFYFGALPTGSMLEEQALDCAINYGSNVRLGRKYNISFPSNLTSDLNRSHELCVLEANELHQRLVGEFRQKDSSGFTKILSRFEPSAACVFNSSTECAAKYSHENNLVNAELIARGTYRNNRLGLLASEANTSPSLAFFAGLDLVYESNRVVLGELSLRPQVEIEVDDFSYYSLTSRNPANPSSSGLIVRSEFSAELAPVFMSYIDGTIDGGSLVYLSHSYFTGTTRNSATVAVLNERSFQLKTLGNISLRRLPTLDHMKAAARYVSMADARQTPSLFHELRRETREFSKMFAFNNQSDPSIPYKNRIFGLGKLGATYIPRWMNEFDEFAHVFSLNLKRDRLNGSYFATLYDRARNVVRQETFATEPRVSELEGMISSFR